MGVILRIAFRNMKRRKARYIMTTITLVIGVALFGGILIARDSFKVMFIEDIDRRMGTADILVRNKATDDGWFDPDTIEDDIEDLDHVVDVSYRISGFNVYVASSPDGNQLDNSTRTSVYGIDPGDSDERDIGGNPTILDPEDTDDTIEELLDDAENDEVIITESLKIKLGNDFEAGDTIWVLPREGEELGYASENTGTWLTLDVIAIIRDLGEARDFDPETPEDYNIPSQGACLFTNLDTAHDLVDGTNNYRGLVNLVAINIDDVNNAASVADDVEDELDDDNWVSCDLKSDTIEDINQSVEIMMTMFIMFALIALILSIILILNIFNIIKEEQEYETGMFQAIGASKSETFRMFLAQGAIMGIIGALIGTICSFFMSYLIFQLTVESLKNMPGFIGETFAQTEAQIILLPQTLGVTFAVGAISCIIAAIYPSWKASRKPVIECLNPLAKKSEREKKHHSRRILFGVIAGAIVAYGAWLLYGVGAVGGPGGGGMSEAAIAFVGPTLILLGIIWLLALFVGPLTAGFIKLFGKYLKQTKLLTKKNVLRHRKRTVLTFSMIAITVSYLVGISVYMGSMREGIKTTVTDVMGCDVRIFIGNAPPSFRGDLKDVDGVDEVMAVTHQNAQLWDDNEWFGHSLLEEDYDESVSVHILDPDIVKERMTSTTILEPSDLTLEDMMDKLEKKDKLIITEKEADKFDLDVGDDIQVRFSLGLSYPTVDALLERDDSNAQEQYTVRELEVVAIVEKFQGFATGEIVGQDEDEFNIYISWQTWEDVTRYDLPGGNTDLVFRKITESGNQQLDAMQTDWFNFSSVEPLINGINEIDYYTTRMEYYSPSIDNATIFNPNMINLTTPVVGLRTQDYGKLKSDAYFGTHQLIDKSNAYTGNTIEQLLNTTDKVCVVDQSYIKGQQVNNPSFGINSSIRIFPQEFQS
ncbi:MAG: FtsX-like permease family protein, partial [Candidatus Lokiarchaeota archaeon]|nr:FtsX-like permease family protein [Candidatus Lokiarchaeota archaeon]MBD3342154.1 FtsX-like permease family protein [Candidatus Lokiarchaeota archaeon]